MDRAAAADCRSSGGRPQVGPVGHPDPGAWSRPSDRGVAMPASGRSRSPLEPREILGGLVIVGVGGCPRLPTSGPPASSGAAACKPEWAAPAKGRREPPALADWLLDEAPSGPKASARAERASASSSPPIAVIEGDGASRSGCFTSSRAGSSSTTRTPRVHVSSSGGPGHRGLPLDSITSAFHLWKWLIFVRLRHHSRQSPLGGTPHDSGWGWYRQTCCRLERTLTTQARRGWSAWMRC
jgi:hypothetical protein